MIDFKWFTFKALTNEQLYAVMKLRAEIFVVEQHCPYLDPDGRDAAAFHLLGMDNSQLVAYLRLFPPTSVSNHIVFGRIVTCQSVRGQGYGQQLMQTMIGYCEDNYPGIAIRCSAQHYLLKFYNHFGFEAYGDMYPEDGIPHIAMQKNSDASGC